MQLLIWYFDLGHGEHGDPGAVNGTLVEHTINVVVGNACADEMRRLGHTVYVEQGNLEIMDSAAAANACGADKMISFHENAGGGDRGEVIHNWKEGATELAIAISNGMKLAGQTQVNVYKSPANTAGTGEYFGILRGSKMAGCIAECAFIDNPVDRQIIDTLVEQQYMGYCIAKALCKAYGSSPAEDITLRAAVNKLVANRIIASPDYWVKSVENKTPIAGEWMNLILIRMTKATNLQHAVAILSSVGVIGSPDYWNASCIAGMTVNPAYARVLIVNAVDKLNL